MNLPNKLTILRIVLTFVFMAFLFAHGVVCKILALLIFIFAAITDFLDGYIAKKYNLVTDFGKFMDPIADKVLTLSAFIAFVEMGLVQAWMAALILFREFAVTGLRLIVLRRGEVISAETTGKYKTAAQMAAISLTLIFIILRETGGELPFWTPGFERTAEAAVSAIMYAAVILTVISGISFFSQNRIHLPHERKDN